MKMKMMTALAVSGILVLAGCGTAKEETNESEQIPNPYTEVESIEKAEEITGFTLDVPEWTGNRTVQVMDEKMIEVIDFNGEEEVRRFRKASGTDDISGNYNNYSDVKEEEINGNTVTLKGTDGAYELAVWNDGSYSYAVSTVEMSESEFVKIIEAVK